MTIHQIPEVAGEDIVQVPAGTATFKSRHPETIALHGGSFRYDPATGAVAVPIYQTSSFQLPGTDGADKLFALEAPGHLYTRVSNPTQDAFEQRLAELEGGAAALAHSSGQAASAFAVLNVARAGDNIVSAAGLYGGTWALFAATLKSFGIETRFVDASDPEAFEKATDDRTRAYYAESLPNPKLEVFPIAEVAAIGREMGIPLIMDNTAAPIICKPLELGAHVVVYSATKHIDGQGRSLGGVILSDKQWIDEHLQDYFRHTGPAMSPFTAWTLLKGIETLPLRVAQQTTNAAKVADFLAEQTGKVARVIYPGRKDHPQADIIAKQMSGGSTLVAFELKGGKEAAFKLQNALDIVKISNNLGDSKSLITHPATTTHKNLTDEARAERHPNRLFADDGAFGDSDYSYVEFDDFASDDFGAGSSTYN